MQPHNIQTNKWWDGHILTWISTNKENLYEMQNNKLLKNNCENFAIVDRLYFTFLEWKERVLSHANVLLIHLRWNPWSSIQPEQ